MLIQRASSLASYDLFSKLSEEDKIILTAVKEYEDEKDACDFIMKEGKLEGRSADEVKHLLGFEKLLACFTSRSSSRTN